MNFLRNGWCICRRALISLRLYAIRKFIKVMARNQSEQDAHNWQISTKKYQKPNQTLCAFVLQLSHLRSSSTQKHSQSVWFPLVLSWICWSFWYLFAPWTDINMDIKAPRCMNVWVVCLRVWGASSIQNDQIVATFCFWTQFYNICKEIMRFLLLLLMHSVSPNLKIAVALFLFLYDIESTSSTDNQSLVLSPSSHIFHVSDHKNHFRINSQTHCNL